MRELDYIDDDQSDTVFRDLIMLTLSGFVVIVFLLLPHINPKAEQTTAEVDSPGNLIVEARWPDDVDADVDLWVQGPEDRPVGYSNQSAGLFNLLRDDLGTVNDMTKLNYEVAYSRGAPAGEYFVNLHLYSNRARHYPVPVIVTVSLKGKPTESAKRLLNREIELTARGKETTVYRFKVGEDSRLVKDSVHDIFKPLRSVANKI